MPDTAERGSTACPCKIFCSPGHVCLTELILVPGTVGSQLPDLAQLTQVRGSVEECVHMDITGCANLGTIVHCENSVRHGTVERTATTAMT